MAKDFLWWRDGIIYQIYPRSYQDSNEDGIGDLPGITQKLDYLKELDIDAIWLSPIYPSPDVDYGYDVADYVAIDPKFGNLEEFDILIEQAHQRGIHIILDLVLNHTSDQHQWFIQSRSSRDNPFRDWYIWRDAAAGGGEPNNWQSAFGGNGWEWDANTNQYYFHMFYKEQPDLNWQNPSVQNAILNVVEFWLKRGVDGFRLDVFNAFFKSQTFKNNPFKLGRRGFEQQHHIYDINQPELIDWLQKFRALLDSYPQRYSVGESFEATPETAALYVGEKLLHATFDFSFLKNRFNPSGFYHSIQRWENALEGRGWPNYVMNNHDVIRSASRYTRNENDARLKILAAMHLTLRGTPYLYYGEEIGMRDIRINKRKQVLDPIGKRYWPFYKGRDGCRSPMQWDDSLFAGFSSRQSWLPVNENFQWRNVESQKKDPDSLFNFYKQLIHLRKTIPALQRGMYLPLTFDPRRLLAYMRKLEDETVLVALNFSRRKVSLMVSTSILHQKWQLLFSNSREEMPDFRDRKITLAPYEVLLLSSD